jgi:hypothetical protein
MQERPDLGNDLEVISNPEFLREGRAVDDSLHPDRLLVGATSQRGFETMRRLYDPLIREAIASSRRTSRPPNSRSTPVTRSWHSRSRTSTRLPVCVTEPAPT